MKFEDLLDRNQLKILKYTGGCSSCPRGIVDYVPATLKDTPIILVGEAPGADEVAHGEGFIGQTGQFLRSSLKQAGITEDQYSLTNTIHCRPPGNKNPTDKEISCCMNQYVMQEVRNYPIVVLVGAIPTKAFFPNSRFKNLRGNVTYHPDFPGQRFYVIYHPGYVTRNKTRENLKLWNTQLGRLKRVLDEGTDCPWDTYHGEHADFLDKLKTVLNSGKFCFDIETNNKLESWHPDARIVSFSICSTTKAALFCHEDDLVWEQALGMVGEALEKPKNLCVGHNVGFDVDFMERKLGIHARCKFLDTQCVYYLAHQLKLNSLSLKYLTSQYLDGYRFLVPNPGADTNIELLTKYNTEDVVRTLQLAQEGLKKLSKRQKDLLLRVSSPSGVALRRLTSTGFLFDVEAAKESKKNLIEERETLIRMWKEEDPMFEPETHLDGDGLIRYLYKHRKLPAIKFTDKANKPATDKYTLSKLRKEHNAEYLDWLIRLKAVEKFENTFVDEYLSGKYMDFDQRVHASYHNTTTKTGRSSSSNPNGQQQPRDDTIKKSELTGISKPFSLRKLYTAPDGCVLLHSDLSQIELRVLMSLANDPVGIQAYQDEGDLHWQTARMIAAGEGREATKLDRTHAKPTNFGLCVPLSTEILTRDGWKTYKTVKIGDETLGYNKDGGMEWTPVIGKIKQYQQETIKLENNIWSVVTTPNHRWYGDKIVNLSNSPRKIEYVPTEVTTEEITASHRLWLSKPYSGKENPKLTPDEAAIIGWLYTDGSLRWAEKSSGRSTANGKRRGLGAYIFQKKSQFIDNIRNILNRANYKFTESKNNTNTTVFTLRAPEVRELLRRCDLEYGSLFSFILTLGPKQLESFVKSVQEAEGTKMYNYKLITQNCGDTLDAIELAIFLMGYFPRRSSNGFYKENESIRLRMGKPLVTGQRLEKTNVGLQDVWCPQTTLGSWTMRQNGQIMVTGNSYCHVNEAYTLKKNAANEYGIVLSDKQAQKYSDTFFKTYKRVRPWQLQVIQELRANKGFAETVMGHKWYYPEYNSQNKNLREKAEREAINLMCQSTAGYITLYILYLFQQELHKQGHANVKTVGSVHDSILTEVPEDKVPEVIHILQSCVDKVAEWIQPWFKVPLVMEFEVGPNWSKLQKVDVNAINV